MDNYLQEIINKFSEFSTYLKEIDINNFKKFTRQELIEFEEKRKEVFSFRHLNSEIDKIIEEKKLQEFPELLGVHHYPEIKELDCISDEDKVKLDNYLSKLKIGFYIYTTSGYWYDFKRNWAKNVEGKVFDFLISKGICEKYYELKLCHNDKTINNEKLQKYFKFISLIKNYKSLSDGEFNEYLKLEEELDYLEHYCTDCGEKIDITEDTINNLVNNPNACIYKIIKEKDKTYDNK